MDVAHLDLIRFALDAAICLACLLLMVQMGRRRMRHSTLPAKDRPQKTPRAMSPGLSPELTGTDTRAPTAGAMRTEILRLTRAGRSVADIARRTGVAQGEIALIQKFADRDADSAEQ